MTVFLHGPNWSGKKLVEGEISHLATKQEISVKVGSLFSGIGGLDLGLERVGMDIVWQCEINPYARKVLKKHWSDIPCYEDVKKIDERVQRPEVLCGGFPCQDVSFAGKRAGLHEGTRTGLWFEFARIIRCLRPRYVLLENVPGLLSLGFGRVLGDLAEIGYDAEWQVLSAAQFELPHKRERVFVVAYPTSNRRDNVFNKAPDYATMQGIQDYKQPGYRWERKNGGHSMESVGWTIKPEIRGGDDGLPIKLDTVDRLKCLGNAVVPLIAQYLGGLIQEHVKGKQNDN